MIQVVVAILGALIGGSISIDLSHHPAFPVASDFFPIFWLVAGGMIGWVVGGVVYDFLDRHYLL